MPFKGFLQQPLRIKVLEVEVADLMAMALYPLAASLGTGLVASTIFRRYEPRHPFWHFILLLGFPLIAGLWVVDHLVVLLMSTVAYRLSPYHPLARFPGPLLCRVTQLRALAAAVGGKRARWLISLHRDYGSHVRVGKFRDYSSTPRLDLAIGPNEVSMSDVDAMQVMFNSPQWRKSDRGYLLSSKVD